MLPIDHSQHGRNSTAKILLSYALAICGSLMCCMFVYAIYDFCLKPKILRAKLRKQGIRGPTPSLVLGNIPYIRKFESKELESDASTYNLNEPLSLDCCSILLPHISQWTNQFGMRIVYYLMLQIKHLSC